MTQLGINRKMTPINIIPKTVFICYFLFASSCLNESKKRIIAGSSGRHWDISRMEKKTYKYPQYGYYFQINGKCIYYFNHYRSKTLTEFDRAKFDFGDEVIPETWSLKNDSIINIMGFDYKIIYLTTHKMSIVNILNMQDTIFLGLSNKN
jgi:hypothetical protein